MGPAGTDTKGRTMTNQEATQLVEQLAEPRYSDRARACRACEGTGMTREIRDREATYRPCHRCNERDGR